MSHQERDDRQLFVLDLLARAKDRKRGASNLKDRLGTTQAKAVGLGDADGPDAVLGRLIADGLIACQGPGAADARHPRPKATYRLTEHGAEVLQRVGPRAIEPTHDSEQLLACQKAYILLQFLRVEERLLSRAALNAKLKTRAAKEQLTLDPPTVNWVLALLVQKGDLTARTRGTGTVYQLTDGGKQYLAATEQYPTVRFTLTGAELNALVAAGREPPIDKPEDPVKTEDRVLDERELMHIINELRRKAFAHQERVPIHEVRRRVARDFGSEHAGHQTLDPLLQRLRSKGQLRLIAISDLRDATPEQLANSVPGMNETLFYVVHAHEPVRV